MMYEKAIDEVLGSGTTAMLEKLIGGSGGPCGAIHFSKDETGRWTSTMTSYSSIESPYPTSYSLWWNFGEYEVSSVEDTEPLWTLSGGHWKALLTMALYADDVLDENADRLGGCLVLLSHDAEEE